MRSRVSSLFFLVVIVALADCAEQAPLEGAACPCADGWTCCASNNVCVAVGDVCPVDDSQIFDFTTEGKMARLGVDRGACAGTEMNSDGTKSWIILASPGGADVLYADKAEREIYTFAETGLIQRLQTHSTSTDGTVQSIDRKWEYLVDGRLTSVTTHESPSTTSDRTEYHYLQNGRIIVEDYSPCCAAEGLASRSTRQPDAQGRILTEEADYRDDNGILDGVPDRVTTNSFGPRGIVEKRESFANGWSVIVTYSYDEAGRNTGFDVDSQADGTVDSAMIKTWDDDGRLVRREFRNFNADGTVDSDTIDYLYDCR